MIDFYNTVKNYQMWLKMQDVFLSGQRRAGGENSNIKTVNSVEGEDEFSNLIWRRPERRQPSWTRCFLHAESPPGGAGSPWCSPLWTAWFASRSENHKDTKETQLKNLRMKTSRPAAELLNDLVLFLCVVWLYLQSVCSQFWGFHWWKFMKKFLNIDKIQPTYTEVGNKKDKQNIYTEIKLE